MTTLTDPARSADRRAAPASPHPLFAGVFGNRPCPNDLAETVGDFTGLQEYAASIAPAPSQQSLDELRRAFLRLIEIGRPCDRCGA